MTTNEDLVKLLAQNICDERWGEDGEKHAPGYWDYRTAESNIKALEDAGYTITRSKESRKAHKYVDENGDQRVKVTNDPRWAEADDVPDPSDYDGSTERSRAWMAQCSEPPAEEPVPECAHPDKRKYRSRAWAKAGAQSIRKKVGETAYQTLYPYECPAGGHWHLSHYRQGKAKCPACQLPQAAWKGGEDYWVIAKHNSFGNAGLCNGTGERVRQGVSS